MTQHFILPDTGSSTPLEVLEIHVKAGDAITPNQTLLTLESDKATIDVPADFTGKIIEILVKPHSKVQSGDSIFKIESQTADKPATNKPDEAAETTSAAIPQNIIEALPKVSSPLTSTPVSEEVSSEDVYASPSIRRLARLMGVNLTKVTGTGSRGRITKEDVQNFIKHALSQTSSISPGTGLPQMPAIDFSQWGPVEVKPLLRIKRISAQNLSRNWLLAPHVTQFDEADITDLEKFRKARTSQFEKQGLKLTPLVFIMKAVVVALKQFPAFNASLDETAENLVFKNYFHIGIAVDTPDGLVVPVIRDVDQKSVTDLTKELAAVSTKARNKQLTAKDMQGSTFTISSLGGIGGTAFTPIINLPNVAILGVSKSSIKPLYDGKEFLPRLMLPLSLSYDHRVIDGAEAARFIVFLSQQLKDLGMLDL